jgi:ubiquinone/menaquinone biosynthesis C-methylase UbiE
VSLFGGTAWYYARYRPAYPPELLDRLAAAAGLDGTGRLLDLGCGPGLLAVPLARHVAEVVAVDVEPEMLAELPPQIHAVEARAEDVDESWGAFRLVTIGRAFHWMDGPRVLDRLSRVTRQVALVGDSHEHSEAQTKLLEISRELFGERPAMKQPTVRYAQALAESPFEDVIEISVEVERTWTVDQLIGYAYSTSFASLARVGERREEFERVLRERLKPFYRERTPVDALLGRIAPHS